MDQAERERTAKIITHNVHRLARLSDAQTRRASYESHRPEEKDPVYMKLDHISSTYWQRQGDDVRSLTVAMREKGSKGAFNGIVTDYMARIHARQLTQEEYAHLRATSEYDLIREFELRCGKQR